MKRIMALVLFVSFYHAGITQIEVPYFGRIQWVNGYAKEIAGENIDYFSVYPDYATVALLTRCTDGNKAIEWETAPVPQKNEGRYVYFSWIAAHSSGTSKDRRGFDLYANGEKVLTFWTLPGNQQPDWSFGANDSSRIVFQQIKRDASDDAHGIAFLRLPVEKLRPGFPVRLKVVGHSEGSNDWYMTFKFSFEEKIDITPVPFLMKNGQQTLLLAALHFGKDKQIRVSINNGQPNVFELKNGMSNFDVPITAVHKDDSVHVVVKMDTTIVVNKFVLVKPVVYREIYFIHHSHTDIGYSHLQPEVLRIHMKNIDDALRMINLTRNYSAEAKFKWNIESLWVVENYLKQATEGKKQEFIKAVKEGSICLSGLYANILTGLSEPEEVFHYTDFAGQMRRQYGIKIESAMISDIPGYSWTTVTGLAKGGIRYFSSGPNYLGENHPYLGDRVGSFVKTWGDRPVWWASPSGEEKVLFWTAGKGYSSWHGTSVGGVFEKGPKKIASYMNELSDQNYPYSIVQWRYNVVSDNGPLDTTISDFVMQWNKKYASPKIILGTTDQLFEAFEKKYGKQIPTVRGDITPYWEDGAFSTAYEEGKNRNNSMRLQQLNTLYSILSPARYSSDTFYKAWKNILLFHEHTWGAFNSTSEPDLPFVTSQWQIKKQFMLSGDLQVNRIEKALFDPFTDSQSTKIVVMNTASWGRSGPVVVKGALHLKSVKDEIGRIFPLQTLSDGSQVFIPADVSPLKASVFRLTNEETGAGKYHFTLTDSSVSNGRITIQWDSSGSLSKLLDHLGFNYAGTFNGQGLNSYWYVPGLDPARSETTRSTQMKVLENGPVVVTIALMNDAPGCNSLERRITLYAGSDILFIDDIVNKKSIREKESVHFGFPFNASFRKTRLDAGYGSIEYLKDQLPGSNLDYLYARRWMDVSDSNRGIQWVLHEAPLVEPETMVDERRRVNGSLKEWKTTGKPTSRWFSYIMNNYWHTNYKADQEGVSHFRYALRPHREFDDCNMEKTAFELTEPLLAVPVRENEKVNEGLFELSNNHIIVTSVTPAEQKSLIIRLFNPASYAQQTRFLCKFIHPSRIVNLNTGTVYRAGQTLRLASKAVTEIMLIQ